MSLLRYLSHPEVVIDPDTPADQWLLAPVGRARARRATEQPWVAHIGRIVTSPEPKALEFAALLGERLGLPHEIRSDTGEIDRSSTGFVPFERHEALADRCFGQPDVSADGWETALAAKRRIVAALADLLTAPAGNGEGDVAVVGHGGVGTLLFCHLTGLAIGRDHDQPGQGHHWAWDRLTGRAVHGWRPIDE